LVVNSGTYTFYALDEAGNETVQVITLTAQSGSGGVSAPGPGDMPPPPDGGVRMSRPFAR
jgi:hypothetical protein